jgi:hypothetical protein
VDKSLMISCKITLAGFALLLAACGGNTDADVDARPSSFDGSTPQIDAMVVVADANNLPDASVAPTDADVVPNDADVMPTDADIVVTDADVPDLDANVMPADADIPPDVDVPPDPDADPNATSFDEIHAIFVAKCSPCHETFGSGGHNIGQSDVDLAYADSQLASTVLQGETKGAAALFRIQNGSMPLGRGCTGNPVTDAGDPDCLTQEEQDLIQSWLDDGQLPPQ